jgi:hypothetical protein
MVDCWILILDNEKQSRFRALGCLSLFQFRSIVKDFNSRKATKRIVPLVISCSQIIDLDFNLAYILELNGPRGRINWD